MKIFCWISLLFLSFVSVPLLHAQDDDEDLDEAQVLKEFDLMVFHWEESSQMLDNYEGLKKYCFDREFKKETIDLLDQMHHYDSLLYKILLQKMQEGGGGRELRVTIHEIEKFETKYKPKKFLAKLNDDCKGEHYLERHKKDLERETGMEAYDGQALVIGNDAATYIHHINRLLDLIEKHAHHLVEE